MAGFRIEGNLSGNVAEVDGYGSLFVNTPTTETDAGFVCMAAESDAGTVTGIRTVRALEATEDYRLRVGIDTMLFNEIFASTTLNTSIWTAPVNSMTVVITNGFCVLNSGGSVTTANECRLQTWRYFPMVGSYGTYFEMLCAIGVTPQLNNVTEWGVGIATARSTPTDGAFFRLDGYQNFTCVLNYNGTEQASSNLNFTNLVGVNICRHFIVNLTDDAAEFWIDDIKVARIPRPITWAATTSSGNLPIFFRTYNSGGTSLAQQLKIGQVTASLADMQNGKPWSHTLCGAGNGLYQGPSGATVGQSAQLAIAANPAAGTPTATTATPTVATTQGLGGIYVATITGGPLVVTNNYIISAHLNPVASATVQGRTLYITGFKFNSVNMGATNLTTPLTYAVGLNFGSTALDPATAESATAKSSRRIVLGVQTIAVNAIAGTLATPEVVADFSQAPIVVNQGEYISSYIRFITYTSTSSQALWCYVTFMGYWE